MRADAAHEANLLNPKPGPLLREHFPVSRRLIYFNHAAVAPLATPTRRAMETLIADVHEYGARNFQQWDAVTAKTRQTLARLIGATAEEIALLKNTSEGLSMVAQGFPWQAGDIVVVPACEFPANIYPWLRMRERGVRIKLLPESALSDLDQFAAACRGARLLSISFVQYLSGFRIDPVAVGRICRECGVVFVLDAIQGLGAFPIDVKRAGVHVLVADGHKWLTGPEGAGLMFVDEAVMDEIVPREVGWMSVANWSDLDDAAALVRADGQPGWRSGAARYECGTSNTVGIHGLGAAAALLLDAGIDAIAAHVLALSTRLASGLEALGCRLRRIHADPEHNSGIVSFQHPGCPASALAATLGTAGVVCACRGDWVRLSPHLYNTGEEVDTVLDRVRTSR